MSVDIPTQTSAPMWEQLGKEEYGQLIDNERFGSILSTKTDDGTPKAGFYRSTPPPKEPMAVARHLSWDWWHKEACTTTVKHWRGTWMQWTGSRWIERDNQEIRAALYREMERAQYETPVSKDKVLVKPWAPNRSKIADLMDALASVVHLPPAIDAPSWLTPHGATEAENVIACTNGLLDMATRTLTPHTPRLFNTTAVPFDYDPDAPQPARWTAFLESVWPDDPDAITALQDWFGYVLSGRTDLQKILLMVGPMRSGKGTIARVLTALVGKANVSGPTMSGLTTNFGMADLIGKSLAVVADARLPRQGAETIVERLLTISGEDAVTVDRKHRDPWSGRLPARFMLLSNELPAFKDSSGAIASRLIVLTMTISNLGREDTNLERDLAGEMPGILNWALDGLDRVRKNRRLSEPASSAEAVDLLAASVSPIKAFISECCELDQDATTPKNDLYQAWRDWCKEEGRDHPGTKPTFSRDLFAANLGVKEMRARVDGARVQSYAGVRLLKEGDGLDWIGQS